MILVPSMIAPRSRVFVFSTLLVLFGSVSAVGQTYRREAVQDLRIQFKVHKALTTIPTRLGDEGPLSARYDTQDSSDSIHGRYGAYAWHLYVYQFDLVGKDGPTTPGGGGAKAGETPEEIRKRLTKTLGPGGAKNFEEWVRDRDPSRSEREFQVEAKEVGKDPECLWWEYTDVNKMRVSGKPVDQLWFHMAAVYQIAGKEVVLVCVLPIRKGNKPDSKWYKVGQTMLRSVDVMVMEDMEDETNEKKDFWAQTPEQKKALGEAKSNISDLSNWDYLTTKSYIILFSWEKPEKRKDAWGFAREVARKMEEIRELFIDYYPPHETQEMHYSVIRVCSNYDEFSAYGQTPRGVVGWFSPGSKELVIFFDSDRIFGAPEDAIQVSFHEAWHQYSDGYFPDVELHRWFDEGLAEFFSAHVRRGSGWGYEHHQGRFDSIRRQLQTRTYIPLKDIVYWSRAQFYGPRAPDHYAQGYAFLDFLQRGQKRLKGRWKDEWTKIVDTYGETCLTDKDPKKAVDLAFEGVNFDELESAWINWTENYLRK